MNKYLFTIGIFLGLQTIASAQIDKNVGDFTSLKASNRIKIELIPSQENKIVVNESQVDAVNIINKNGRLVLKNTLKELVSETNYSVTIQVHFKELKEIDAQGGSYIYSDSVINQNKIALSSNFGSTLNVKLNTESLTVNANTGSKIHLQGKVSKTAKITASSGAQISADALITNKNIVKVNSGSNVKATATNYFEAQVLAGGIIKIYGNPEEVKEKITLGGTIEYIK